MNLERIFEKVLNESYRSFSSPEASKEWSRKNNEWCAEFESYWQGLLNDDSISPRKFSRLWQAKMKKALDDGIIDVIDAQNIMNYDLEVGADGPGWSAVDRIIRRWGYEPED